MKKLLIVTITFLSFASQAQKNTLLERSFWKTNPTLAAVETEIKNGNSPSELNSSAFDPVVLAINEQVSNDIIKLLLSYKENDANKITHDGRTYIFWAASKGNVEIMEVLFSKGAKSNHIDDKGYSVLNFAASSGQTNLKVYDLCIAKGINPKTDLDSEGANALLLIAPHDKDFTLFNYFISKGLSLTSTDKNGNTAFNYAAKTGNLTTLKSLLEKGVKYNDNAMILASQGGRGTANKLEVYEYLESLKINPNAIGINGENVLHGIVRKEKQLDIIKHFVSKGVDVNKSDTDGTTPFMNAASANGELEVIYFLYNNIKDINQKNIKGVSSLALAIKNNTSDVVQFLVEKGADVTSVDNAGDNLSSYLIQSYNSKKISDFEAKIKILQEKGFDVATPQKNGNTLYHLAVAKNDLGLVQYLEKFKLDVNAKDSEGLTPLHKAALIAKDDVMMKYLLSIGAKKESITDFKEKAYDLALENEYLTKTKVSIDFLK